MSIEREWLMNYFDNPDQYPPLGSTNNYSNSVIRKFIDVGKPKPTVTYPEGHICQCCGRPSNRLFLDHCHLTGIHRGWICPSCNTGLGLLGDDIEGLELAIAYIKRSLS